MLTARSPSLIPKGPTTRFENLLDLSRLPWFDVHDGRLVVSDRSVGPVIDMHSHIALAYLLPMRVDLYRATHHTEHYLPACCGIDFEVYQNKNFTPAALHALKRDLTLGSLSRGGMRATHTVPNLVREMDELGIVRSVLLPIELPYISQERRARPRRGAARAQAASRSARCIPSSIASARAWTSRRTPARAA